jgi:AraC-like DNA-binding protein
MYASAAPRLVAAPSGTANASVVAALFVNELDSDTRGIVIPRPEVHLVVRFGPVAHGGLDVHALGGLRAVRRKSLRGGQRIAMVRLHLGAAEEVLGVPDAALAGHVVALEELWGGSPARRLLDQLADASDTWQAVAILEQAIVERAVAGRAVAGRLASARRHRSRTRLVIDAADRLSRSTVNAVASDLGVSERQLRRVFHETIGVSPKTFAKVTRFRRAVRVAREENHVNWAAIAAAVGYYDQAHLITEFREIAGVTPRALLGELRAARAVG